MAKIPSTQGGKKRCGACQHPYNDQTMYLNRGNGEDDYIDHRFQYRVAQLSVNAIIMTTKLWNWLLRFCWDMVRRG